MIRAVIFDMDGVLIESEDLWAEADRQFAKRHGVNVTDEFLARFKGRRQRDILEEYRREFALAGDTTELLQERIDLVLKILEQRATLVPGSTDLLAALRYNQTAPLRTAVASSSPSEIIEFVMEKFDLWDSFELMVSGDDVEHGKPAPEIYLHVAELLKVKPMECLVVEDSISGILAGKAAGMHTIALAKPYVKPEDSAKADQVIQSLAELTPALISKL